MDLAHHSTLALCSNRLSLLFYTAVAENFVFAQMSSFTSALFGDRVENMHVLEGAYNLAE